MGNSRYYQFLYSKIPMLSMIEGKIVIGASGAVSSFSGNGVANVIRLTTGIYELQMSENYNAFMGADFTLLSGVTGADVSDGSLSVNTPYQITTVGTTNWSAVGLPSGLTPAVGQPFVASSSGGSGSGKAKAITTTGVDHVEVMQNAQTELVNSNAAQGAIIMIQTLNGSLALANPTNGAIIEFNLLFRNSSNAL